MIQTQKKVAKFSVNCAIGIVSALLIFIVLPEFLFLGRFITAVFVFFIASTASSIAIKFIWSILDYRIYVVKDTRLIVKFLQRLRFSYTIEDLIEAIQDVLEQETDSSVLLVQKDTNYVIYNSPTEIVTNPETLEKLTRNFPADWNEGFYLFDEQLGLVSDFKAARGFFISFENLHFYVFCRYVKVFEPSIFETLVYELKNFHKRTQTISQLTAISELSKEWNMVAETQTSFLPMQLPEISKLDIASYFRPLVNVSGDFYDVHALDEHRTFFLLGDVSGKGLASALIMGVVMNTIKILDNKEDLPAVIRAVDNAIKSMQLEDKYVVLFIGIVDTKEMKIQFVNASMADPIILTSGPEGYKIKPLQSNCSLVGIIDLEEIITTELPLYRGDVILMASDGVSEVMDESGVELGDTDLYMTTIKNCAHKPARYIVNDIADLVFEYVGDNPLRDDVTMLVAKLEG